MQLPIKWYLLKNVILLLTNCKLYFYRVIRLLILMTFYKFKFKPNYKTGGFCQLPVFKFDQCHAFDSFTNHATNKYFIMNYSYFKPWAISPGKKCYKDTKIVVIYKQPRCWDRRSERCYPKNSRHPALVFMTPWSCISH